VRLRDILAAGAALCITLTAAPALAADPAASPRQMELAKRLFADMQMDKVMSTMTTQMVPAMTAQMRKSNPNINAEQAQAVTEAINESMAGLMTKLVDRMIPLYAETFSEKELQELVTFYEGPTGRAMLAKMPTLTAKMTPLMTELMPEITADMQRRICSKIDCTKNNAAARPSD
jgi:hypothetical protein